MNKYIQGGEIIAIPLFLTENKKVKLKQEDSTKQFAFARAITEEAGKILIEIFNKTGNLNIGISEITNSKLLMKPLYTIWSGVHKKRWKVISQTDKYDKIKDSNYNDIQLVLGGIDNLRIWHAKDNSETPITREELINGDYQLMGIYTPLQIEKKIIEKLKSKTTKKK
ncbi:immunity 26 domain-containing protein [Tenacibaculum dicentrarchi]|nr:immunity 26 domain-containing protein [Tenacibaculum dicentrarchi]